jgi:hypothetical protein
LRFFNFNLEMDYRILYNSKDVEISK